MRHLGKALFLVCGLSLASLAAVEAAAVPGASSKATKDVTVATGKAASAEAGKVNINTATAAELAEGLVGIGPKKAEAIVAWRTANGPFKTAQELLNVKGIGESLLEKNTGRFVFK